MARLRTFKSLIVPFLVLIYPYERSRFFLQNTKVPLLHILQKTSLPSFNLFRACLFCSLKFQFEIAVPKKIDY
jgi:hypothetical protein